MAWIQWTQRLAAIAQSGLTYARDPFDIERYEALRQLAADVVAEHTGRAAIDVDEFFRAETGYATPKLDVRGVVFRAGDILLVRERVDGGWTLPGGWADVLDSPSTAIEREIREESGYEARATKIVAVFDRNRHPHPPQAFHVWKVFVRCEIIGGAPRDSIETDGVGFFARDALPELSTTRVTAHQLALMFAHLDDPLRPADFD
ncbi:MAG: NUDIX hydrolase [Candidatus Velthaea sp.]|jgi:ADP-ribose pyrophosphatase YjhB (NUDIX family)